MPNFMDDYETVDTRIHRFWEKYPDGRIVTHLEEIKIDDQGRTLACIVRTEIYKNNPGETVDSELRRARPDSTGYAEESVATSTAPRGSLVETCETSSIGRALANLGFSAKGARPSREEMQKVERSRDTDAQPRYTDSSGGPRPASAKQAAYLGDLIYKNKLDAAIPPNLSAADAKDAIDYILKHRALPPGFGIDVADDYTDEEPF
jgi:hypothetical protein